ncbi:MAG: hypothetical protein LBS19_07800 [Clostridiales bacterium]|nr:hypothetical protein [Clostridiales bacterium]
MQNNNFFKDDSIRIGSLVPAGSAAIAPPAASPVSSAMLLAAADPATKMRVTKEVLHDACRTMLAYTALESVLTLSAIEAHCCQVAPNGAQRYKCIVDAYTAATAARIGRF